MKMIIGMITVATIAAVLAALSVRLFYDNREWQALTEEIQAENEAIRKNTSELCQEKLSLLIDIQTAENEAAQLKAQLDDALTAYENSEKERIALKEQLAKAVNDFAEKGKGNDSNAKESEDIPLLPPAGIHTNTFRCEDYRLFDPRSEQFKLQKCCCTSMRTGIREYISKTADVYLCAAMGGAYGTEIGQTYAVTLRNGYRFNVIVADYKHPIDNPNPYDYGDNDVNYDGQDCICVIEFVVDMKAVPYALRVSGTMSALKDFGGLYGDGGDIVEMKKLERVWKP